MVKRGSKTKKKGGYVYIAESTRGDGSKKLYTGMTRRSPKKRLSEHIKETKKKKSKTWTGKGKSIKLIGAVYSSNPSKAEKTIKKKSPTQKRKIGILGAKRYYKNKGKKK